MRTAILLTTLLLGCNNQSAPAGPVPGDIADPGETVLTVNGRAVGTNELGLVFERMKIPEDQRADFAWTRGGKHVAEEYALATALYDKAVAEKLYEDPKVQMQLAFAERQVLASAMRDKLANSAVSEDAVKKYYEDNKDRFSKPEVHARQIQVADATLAGDLLNRIKGGEDFAQIAKDHSVDPSSRKKGGDVGWFHEHENPLFGEAAFAAEKGAVLGPIQSRVGWHIVEVLDKRPVTPLEDVREEAEGQLKHQQTVSALDEIRKGLKVEWVREPEGGAGGAGGEEGAHGMPPHGSPKPDGAGVAVPGEAPPGGAPAPGGAAPAPGGAATPPGGAAPSGGQMPPGHP